MKTRKTRSARIGALPAVLLAALLAPACGGDSAKVKGGGAPAFDVAAFFPANGATGVDANADTVINFKLPVDTSSVTTADVFLTDANGTTFSPQPAISIDKMSVVLDPGTLAAGMEYTIHVVGGATGVKSAAGAALPAAERLSRFTIASTGGPATDTAKPVFNGASGAQANGPASITVNWTAATDNVTAADKISYSIYRSTSATFTPQAGNLLTSGQGFTSYIDSSGLANNTTYHYIVRAKDEAGNEDTNTVARSATTTSATVFYGTDIHPLGAYNGCTGSTCHSAGKQSGGLNLSGTATSTHTELTTETTSVCGNPASVRAVAFDPDGSPLVKKLEGTSCGSRMPLNGTPLAAPTMQTIRTWIAEGALNN